MNLGAAPLWFSRVRVLTFLFPRIWVPSLHHPFIHRVHPDQALLSECVVSPATPWPFLWMENQPSLHGVAVHVFQLLFEFLLAPNVEVIKPSLPEMSFLNWTSANFSRSCPSGGRLRLFRRLLETCCLSTCRAMDGLLPGGSLSKR